MRITTREYNLLWLLIKNQDGSTIENLARELNVSVRTVYSDLKRIREYLTEEYDIELRKRGKAYYLSCEDVVILKECGFEEVELDGFSSKSRRYEIIECLLDMKTTTLQEIADTLYLSRSTINQELKAVEKILSKFSINLIKKPYHGIVINGTELNIRFLLQYIIHEQIESIDTHLENMMFASKFLTRKTDMYFQELLKKYKQFNNMEVRMSLNVMYHRVKNKHYFSASESLIDMYEGTQELLDGIALCEQIEKDLGIKLERDEVYFLLININSYEVKEENHQYVNKVLDSILELLKEKYEDIKIRETIFYNGLMIHISKMLKRIKFGKIIRNPALYQIKENLPFAFNISADIAMMLKNNFDINMNEDEIGLLAMHIQAMMEDREEKSELKYEGIVVSNIGYGNARMISGRLYSSLPELNIKHLASVEQIEELISEKRIDVKDVIISTYPLSIPNEKYVLINHVITDGDISKISRYLEDSKCKETINPEYSGLAVHILKEHIYLDKTFKSKEKLLEYVCNRLYETGYVTEEFYESTLARERISSTYALNGVALPHGYSKCVKKTGISVVILDKPIDWDGYYADMVFVCALSLNVRESDKKIFEDMYTILNNKSIIRQIKDCKDKNEVIYCITNNTKGELNEN